MIECKQDRKVKRIDAKVVALSGILTGMSIMWIAIMPVYIDLGMWSFTLFSHIFIFIALLIDPVTAILVTVGTVLGFFFKGASVPVLMRAGSHIIFVLYAAFFLEYVKVDRLFKLIIFVLSTAIVHALFEALAVILAISLGVYATVPNATAIWGVTFGATIAHSIIDTLAALAVFSAIRIPLKMKTKVFLLRKKSL